MESKEFVKKVILDLDQAITEVNSDSDREVRFKGVKDQKAPVEFDVAVTVESNKSGKAEGGIRVWEIVQAGGSRTNELKNSTVSRVTFGIGVSSRTRNENLMIHNQQFKDVPKN